MTRKRWIIIGLILSLLVLLGLGWYRLRPKPVPRALVTATVPRRAVVGKEILVPIRLDTQGYTINAAELFLQFHPSELKITDVVKDGSLIRLWIKNEPTYSNELGSVSLAGGIPKIGFKGEGLMVSLKVIPLKPGTFHLTFSKKSRILIHDGRGTAVPLSLPDILVSSQ